MLVLAEHTSVELTLQIRQLCEYLQLALPDFLLELVPSYTTILLVYNLDKIDYIEFCLLLKNALKSFNTTTNKAKYPKATLHTIPVCYHETLGLDLTALAKEKNISVNEIINCHTSRSYLVSAIGFSPAFAYLAEVDPKIQTPRLTTPRLNIAAGSVGIAENQTAIYPVSSAAGWKIIGQTSIDLSLTNPKNLTRFKVGDSIQFTAISFHQFKKIKPNHD